MVIACRRCAFKDYFYESAGPPPTRFAVNAGAPNWTIVNGKMDFTSAVLCGSVAAPAENGVIHGTVRQFGKMIFKVQMVVVGTVPGWYMDAVFFATAAVGAYLGNSYVIRIDAANITLYKSAANVLGAAIAQTATAHAAGNTYNITITYDSATGNWTIDEGAVNKITITAGEHSLTGGMYLGFNANVVHGRFADISLCNDWDTLLASSHVFHRMSKGVSTFEVIFGIPDGSGTPCNYQVGDGIELYLVDDTQNFLDMYAKVERIDTSSMDQIVISGRDWRCEALDAEGVFVGGAPAKVDAILSSIIMAQLRTLRNAGIKATADAPAVRNLNGENCYATIWKLAQEAGYAMWQDPDGKFNITNTYVASGIAMDESGIFQTQDIDDTTDTVNTTMTYFAAGGSAAGGGSGTSYDNEGKKTKIIIDPQIPNAGQAAARAAYWIGNYSTHVPVVDIYVFKGWKILLGQTGTITCKWLNLTNQAWLCIEKEYNIPNGTAGVRLRLVLSANNEEKHKFDFVDKVGLGIQDGRFALGLQI